MIRSEFERFVALTEKRTKLEVSFEVMVDGQWEEVTEIPAVRRPCDEEACDCRNGIHVIADDAVIAEFPEIESELLKAELYEASFGAEDKATRRAEQGWADA